MRFLPAFLFILAGAPLMGAPEASAASDERLDRLSEEHRTWLERDVVYIITEREREVFLTLETVEERNRFIEAFWRKRDPNLATPENEFKIEHYRRLEYANKYLGRETFREGWRTDRGKFYIILGEPREIQRYDGYGEIVSAHLWFYQGEPRMGTPAFFYLLFFKRNDVGEYRLYHPVIDGPQALLRGNQFNPGSDPRGAVQALRQVSAELAQASLSFDTSEPPDFNSARPALGTDIMLARIEDSPRRAIRSDYADAWLRYGKRVSSEYSFNYIPSRSTFSVLADPSGMALVEFSIEIDPQDFSLETDEDKTKFYTTLDLTTEARTEDGTLVYARDKEAYVELSPSQMRQLGASPFAYQDDFPLVPGDYTVTVIVRNRVLTQYTVAEQKLHVPRFDGDEPSLTDLVVAFDSQNVDGVEDERLMRTYQIGSLRFQPAAGHIFVIGETVHLVTQAVGASPEHEVVFELLDGDEVLTRLARPVTANGVVVEYMKLADLVGGNYGLRARLVSPSGETVAVADAPITVSPRSTSPRPGFVYRRGINTRIPGLLAFLRGEQLMKLGKLDEAVATGNERLVPARFSLANVYLKEERPDDALALLRPLEESFPEQYEVVAGIGFAVYLKGVYADAARYLERARGIRPPDAMLLNALGDSYEQLGDHDKAREAFERSLELEPEQPSVKARLQSLAADRS